VCVVGAVWRLWPVPNSRVFAESLAYVDDVLTVGQQSLRQRPAGSVAALDRPDNRLTTKSCAPLVCERQIST
jgi:hypothetical protein